MWKYPPDVNVSETCIDANLNMTLNLDVAFLLTVSIFENGRKTGPRQLSPFPTAGMMRVEIPEIALKWEQYGSI